MLQSACSGYTLISFILLVSYFASLYFFGDGYFFSLSKLVGESAPLPKPRKFNVNRVSSLESLKTPMHKVQGKTISSCDIKENIQAINPKNIKYDTEEKYDHGKDKETCAIISTIPKCEHLDAIRKDNALNNIAKRIIAENVDEFCEKHQNYQSEESSGARNAKRTKVVRSQSKSDDFEMDIWKKQRRYLTLPPEDIAHTLNLNFPARNSMSSDIAEKNRKQILTGHCTDRAGNTDIDKRESYSELITGACCCTTN